MTTFQETNLVSLRHGGVYGGRWGLLSTRRRACRTKGQSGWGERVVLIATLLLFAVLPGPSADASPVIQPSSAAVKICPGEDIATKVNQAGKVVGGTARALSQPKDGVYNVTFSIKHVFKGKKSDFADLKGYLRLQFANKMEGAKHQCNNETDVSEVPVRANIRRGRKYIVFVDEVEPKIFKPHGEPVIRNKENLRAVNASLCGVPPQLSGMKDKHEVELKNTLRLECRMRGRNRGAGQQYKLRWFKDGVKLEPARMSRIRIKRRRLVITDVKPEDKGEYECRAVSPRCGTVSLKAKVTVKADPYPVPPFPAYVGTECEANGFCLNGGTCTWIMVIGEMVCHCAEGFKGQRCDHKDALNTATFQLESWTLARTI